MNTAIVIGVVFLVAVLALVFLPSRHKLTITEGEQLPGPGILAGILGGIA